MSGHAKLSPSSASRWMSCPGSVPLSEGLPNKTSPHAQEGTDAHQLAAACLIGNSDAAQYVGSDIKREDGNGSFTVDAEMAEHVQVYVDEIRRRADGKLLFVEVRVNPERVTGSADHAGTADAVIVDVESDTIEVHDLKYGRGVRVNAENNSQLRLYGLGALCEYDLLLEASMFKLFIHQPRLDHMDEEEVSRPELLTFGATVKDATSCVVSAIKVKDDPQELLNYISPSNEACRWCLAKPTCPALMKTVHEQVFDDFDAAIDPRDMETLPTPSRLDQIELWLKSVRGYIYDKMMSGEEVPGWKMVMGKRGNRKWIDEQVALEKAKKLRGMKVADVTKTSVLSPTQLKKVLGKKWGPFEELVAQSEGSLIMTDADDPREAVTVTDDFNNLEGETNE